MSDENATITIEAPDVPDLIRPRSLWRDFKAQFHMRGPDDDDEQDWWLASTAIPLIAATTAPLANVMSIVALVMPWRNVVEPDASDIAGQQAQHGYSDPHWSIALNATSLACGVAGNLFLLFNFTRTVRYIIALPASILLWFVATGIVSEQSSIPSSTLFVGIKLTAIQLIGLTSAMNAYIPPVPPGQIYSQGYWSAVIAAILYFILCIILLINMLGYVLGHYPQHFLLSDEQRTLILQTTFLVTWLTTGAAIFQQIMDIPFGDALYFSDVTILTLGFGDITAQTNVARGILMPYAVIGVISLGLVVSSIHQIASQLNNDNIVKAHIERKRQATVERSLTMDRDDPGNERLARRTTGPRAPRRNSLSHTPPRHRKYPIRSTISAIASFGSSQPRLLVMREEKDRFDAMRAIQRETARFRRWADLMMSVVAFGIVWTCGAVVFWSLEDFTYFEALYFCFICLLTIGYGDVTPKSNAGRMFFVVWSLIAVPTMTILISEMSDTVVAGFRHATELFADWTVLPNSNKFHHFVLRLPPVLRLLQRHEAKKRIAEGFQVGVDDIEPGKPPKRSKLSDRPQKSIEELARESGPPSDVDVALRLAFAIRKTTQDILSGEIKQYSYEEWVDFTRLIKFTEPKKTKKNGRGATDTDEKNNDDNGNNLLTEDEQGLLNWDWIGENSPMLAEKTESEWLLDRLCESMIRFAANQPRKRGRGRAQKLTGGVDGAIGNDGGKGQKGDEDDDDAATAAVADEDGEEEDDDNSEDDERPTLVKEQDLGLEDDSGASNSAASAKGDL